jgi:hypothetical protein
MQARPQWPQCRFGNSSGCFIRLGASAMITRIKRAVLPVVLSVAGPAQAVTLVSNIGEQIRATTTLDSSLWAAQSFVNDGSVWSLSNIRAVLGGEADNPTLVAELYKGTTSGALLTSFTLPGLSGGQSIRTLLPHNAVTLTPGDTYWLVLGVIGGGSFGFSYAEGNNQTGLGAIGGYQYSFDQGGSWGSIGSDNPYLFEVNVAALGAIPEPAGWAMMIVGFAMIGAVARRRVSEPSVRRIVQG